MGRVRMTDTLLVDTATEQWLCRDCEEPLTDAGENYKRGCLVAARDPTEVHDPVIDGEYTFAPDPEWCAIVEFYCPNCGLMIENEYLPPGHPITHDVEVDLDDLEEGSESRAGGPGSA